MANLVSIDSRQNPRTCAISGRIEPRNRCRTDVKTPCFKDHGDDRESRHKVVASRLCCFP